MIEKQMEQQRYMFEEAHKQKDFLERMFGGLLNEQRHKLEALFREQSYKLQELSELNRKANEDTQNRISVLESVLQHKLHSLQIQIETQHKNTP